MSEKSKVQYKQIISSTSELKKHIINWTSDFSYTLFKWHINLSDIDIHSGLNFNYSYFSGDFTLDPSFPDEKTVTLSFDKSVFKWWAIFEWISFPWRVSFVEAEFEWSAVFSFSSFPKRVDFSRAKFHKEVKICSANFASSVYFKQAVFFKRADFSGSKISFTASFVQSEFYSEADFSRVIFSKTPILQFKSCSNINLQNTIFETIWDFLNVPITKLANSQSIWVIRREFQKMNNGNEAKNWYLKEVERFRSELKWYNIPDRLILFLNKITNNFWFSWLQPIVLIFLIQLWFFVILLYNKTLKFSDISECISYFIVTLNITKSLKDVWIDTTIWFEALNFIKNLILLLLLYQLISSFKKFFTRHL